MKSISSTSKFYLCDWCCFTSLNELEEENIATPVYEDAGKLWGSTIRLVI